MPDPTDCERAFFTLEERVDFGALPFTRRGEPLALP